MGDARSYDFDCASRAVISTDGMTADYFPFPHEFLGRTVTRIITEVRGIKPRRLRRDIKTARYDRVGVSGVVSGSSSWLPIGNWGKFKVTRAKLSVAFFQRRTLEGH